MAPLKSYKNPALTSWTLPGDVQQPSLYYRFMRVFCRMLLGGVWKVRIYGQPFEPASGGVVILSNHQSFLDPVLVTMGLARPGNYMARDTLFRTPGFRQLIESLNAFPIRRGKADISALKEAMRRLRNQRCVVVFPEGTRTRDGRIGRFLPGSAVLSQRAAEWTLPVVIEGAFEVWPRHQALPALGSDIVVRYGEPIPRSQARRHSPEDFMADVRERMIALQADLRNRLGKPPLPES